MIGERFGRLLVLEKAPKIKNRSAWRCQCDCGNFIIVLQQSLKAKATKSCGCFARECATDNLIKQKFVFWTVVGTSKKRTEDGSLYWQCRCECGVVRDVSSVSLKLGVSISCGCSRKRPICPYGHNTLTWGRSKDGMCRACLKNRNLKREYGITLDEFFALYESQDRKCAICKKPLGDIRPGSPGFGEGCRIEVDHQHDLQKPKRETVRGLLCGGRWAGCNRKIGRIDKIEWLESVITYLRKPPAQTFLVNENK